MGVLAGGGHPGGGGCGHPGFHTGELFKWKQGKREIVFITTGGRSVDKDERLRNYRQRRGPQVVQAPFGI